MCSKILFVGFVLALVATCQTAKKKRPSLCIEKDGIERHPHPTRCDKYILCNDGKSTVQTCKNGLLYDGKGNVHNHCTHNWAVDCGTRKANVTPISSGNCEYMFGIYSNGKDCSESYVDCFDGRETIQKCPPNLFYDHSIRACTYGDHIIPPCTPDAIFDFECPTGPSENPENAKFGTYQRFEVPGDCQRMITCVDGLPRVTSCPENEAFDPESLECVNRRNVSCSDD